jgi:hypothetical protein
MTQPVGFATIPNWLLRDKNIPKNVKMMFLILSSHAGPDGIAFPSQETIAELMGCSKDTVKRTLKAMVDLNLIVVMVVKTSTGRRNHYRLMIDALGGVGAPVTPPVGAPEGQEEEPVEQDKTLSSPGVTGERVQSTESKAANERWADKRFDEFWSLYPRKVGKEQARKAYRSAVLRSKVDPDCIIAGLKTQLAFLRNQRTRDPRQDFCPHPSSWLNAGRWEDEVSAARHEQIRTVEELIPTLTAQQQAEVAAGRLDARDLLPRLPNETKEQWMYRRGWR